MRALKSTASAAVGLLVAAGLVVPGAFAQNIQGLPRVSPHAVVSQTVGITEVSIDYHRPSISGRDVWGTLVPNDTVWRAGANDNTTITFPVPVKVEGKDLDAGTYGLHMIPGEDSWTVIFSRNSTSWGSFSYDEAEDALRVEVKAEEAPYTEQLRYQFDDIDDDGAIISLHWEEVKVPFQIEVDTGALVTAKINNDLRHLPGFNWQGWNSAAAYSLQSGIDQEQGLVWADRSISMNENGTNLLVKSGLLTALGRAEEAAEIEQQAIAIATEAQINALGYRYLFQMNDTDKAIELFKMNVADHPDAWNTYDSLGEGYSAKGEKALAIQNYSKALAMAPDNQKARIQGVLDGLEADS